jgi:hypothetical protein
MRLEADRKKLAYKYLKLFLIQAQFHISKIDKICSHHIDRSA